MGPAPPASTAPFVSFGQLSNGYQVSVASTPPTVYPQQVGVRFNQRISTAPAK